MDYAKLTIVTPCFNEAGCVRPFYDAILALKLPIALEILYVDDGSSDSTLAAIREIAALDGSVRYLSFSRNFGKEAALLAGLEHATGDLVVTMDSDLQHRPELLPEMLKAIREEGYDTVATRRVDRGGEPVIRSWFSRRFYSMMNRFSDVSLKDGSMDYRMMTRQVVNEVLRLKEANRFTKGIYQWVGFRTKWIDTENVARVAGKTKWSFMSLLSYSARGLVAFSTAPLMIAAVLGMFCCVLAFGYMAWIFGKWIIYGDPVSGWPTLMCAILILGGLQLFVIGILGTYIAGIYRETKRRPPYIIKEKNQ